MEHKQKYSTIAIKEEFKYLLLNLQLQLKAKSMEDVIKELFDNYEINKSKIRRK